MYQKVPDKVKTTKKRQEDPTLPVTDIYTYTHAQKHRYTHLIPRIHERSP